MSNKSNQNNLLRIFYVLIFGICCIFVLLFIPLRFIRKAIYKNTLNSIWLGVPIINMSENARAERLLGVNSSSLVYSTYFLTSNFDVNLSKWYSIKIIGKLIPFLVFIKACITADRLHFYCDRGIIPCIRPYRFNISELYMYRLLGIEVFLWTYGADVRSRERTKELGEPNCCTNCTAPLRGCLCEESVRIKQINKLKSLSNAIFSMGDMIEYTPGSRNELFFWPVDINCDHGNKYTPVYPPIETERPLRIVHAPNHRMFKGTQHLIDAVKELQADGQYVELILVEKITNEKALEIYRTADIIFDQCLIGFHGYFALEGMAMGKPVMCFIRKPADYLIDSENCPILNIHRDTLKEDIKYYIKNRKTLNEIGKKSRQYIEKYFTLERFAERLAKAYEELGIKP